MANSEPAERQPSITADEFFERQLNEDIAEVRYDMALWELRTQNAYTEGDIELAEQLESEAVEALDSTWPYHGAPFLIVGKWWHPAIELDASDNSGPLRETEGISWSFSEEPVFDIAKSDGFGWRLVNDTPRLGFSFDLGPIAIQKPYMNMTFEALAHALPEDVSLSYLPLPEGEEEVVRRGLGILDTLRLYDRLARLYMTRPEFTSLHLNQQRKQVEKLVDGANERIQTTFSRVVMDILTTHFYEHTEPSTPYGFSRKSVDHPENDEIYSLRGTLVGVGILEQAILSHRALRNEADFIDHDAGLCLVFKPLVGSYTDSEDIPELYIPYTATSIEEQILDMEGDENDLEETPEE